MRFFVFLLVFFNFCTLAFSAEPFEIRCREIGENPAEVVRFEVDTRDVPASTPCLLPFSRANRVLKVFKESGGIRTPISNLDICRVRILADKSLSYSDSKQGFKLVVDGFSKAKFQNTDLKFGTVEYRFNDRRVQSTLICEE